MDIGSMLKDSNSEVDKLAASANPDAEVVKKDPTTEKEAAQMISQIETDKANNEKQEE